MALVDNQMPSTSQSWLGAVNVGYLTEEERDSILEVLWRDEKVRKAEQDRVAKLKTELRDVKRKGAKRAESSYSDRVCARCNSKTGLIFNTSLQCPVCKHKVCKQCRYTGVFSETWKCIVCYTESKLKAETGEWFYGMMRPELRQMQDGTTLVKQAVASKPTHFDQRSSSASDGSKPAIMYTPASSDSLPRDVMSNSSFDTEDTGSSTESRKHRRGKYGPAETGSIESLRARTLPRRSTTPDSGESSDPFQSRSSTLPSNSSPPVKPPRIADLAAQAMAAKKTQRHMHIKMQKKSPKRSNGHQSSDEMRKQHPNQDIVTEPFLPVPAPRIKVESEDERMSDRTSVSSAESKSIDGMFAEYVESQKGSDFESKDKRRDVATTEVSYKSYQDELYDEHDQKKYAGETDDHITQLRPPQGNLPRRTNKKLLQQNQLSVSVPTIYPPANSKKRKTGAMEVHGSDDGQSVEYSMSMNRDLSTSTPNLRDSTTSLNSLHLHDLSITGEIRFSLTFIYKTNSLLVNVVDCRNLATADRKRKRSDPYVKCYLLPDRKNKQKTDVKKRTISPTYNKCLKFTVNHSELSTRVLELSVWHAGTFTRNIFLGQVQVPLDTWDWESKNENWFPLRQRETINADFVRGTMYKGDLILGLKYTPPGALSPGKHKPPYGEMNVLIKQAKNLTPVRSNGTADAYVKIMLQPDKQFRQKTSVIPKTSCPEWNYNIRMQLYQPIEDSGLQLTIWHRDKFQGSTFLGGCRLNLGQGGETDPKWMDATGMEQNLWLSSINSPNQWVDGSLGLRPNM